MIRHIKGRAIRLRRFELPQPPFWCATSVTPYQGPRRSGVAVDWMTLRATAPSRGELTVSEDPVDMLQRERRLRAPLMLDACGFAEIVHGKGEAVLQWAERPATGVVLCSTDGVIMPPPANDPPVLVLGLWPLESDEIDARLGEASAWPVWGACVPLLHPITTRLDTIESLAARVAAAGGSFLTAALIRAEPAAMAALVLMSEDADAEVWESIRDGSSESLTLRSSGIVAAAAHRAGLADRCPFPATRDNWAASAVLAAIADRLFLLDTDPELAWEFQRGASIISGLSKPLTLVAETASLGIIEGLSTAVISALESWLEGREPGLLTRFDSEWRARYDPYR